MKDLLPTEPVYRIWVPCEPRSGQGKKRHTQTEYRKAIRLAAHERVEKPLRSNTIEIFIVFRRDQGLRPDVDNILKPILDTLKGIVYRDDKQVRGLRVLSLPEGEPFCVNTRDDAAMGMIGRLEVEDCGFGILVYEGDETTLIQH